MLKALTVLKDQNFANIVVGQTLTIPVWSTTGRPSPAADGMIGFNSDLDAQSTATQQLQRGNRSLMGHRLLLTSLLLAVAVAAATTLYVTPGQGL